MLSLTGSSYQVCNINYDIAQPNIFFDFENNTSNKGTDGGNGYNSFSTGIYYDSGNKKTGSYSLGLSSTGTSGYFRYPLISSPFNIGNNGITLSVWVRWTSVSANACIFYYSPNGSLTWYANFGSTTSFQVTFGNTNFADTVSNWGLSVNGSWNHFVWSINSSGQSIICINGVQKAITIPTISASNLTSFRSPLSNNNDIGIFILGNYGSTAPIVQTGNIDSFKIWKQALTLNQIQELYSRGL